MNKAGLTYQMRQSAALRLNISSASSIAVTIANCNLSYVLLAFPNVLTWIGVWLFGTNDYILKKVTVDRFGPPL